MPSTLTAIPASTIFSLNVLYNNGTYFLPRHLIAVIQRRPIIHVLLALLLLFSQQMRVAHAVSHWGDFQRDSTEHQQTPAEKICDQCLAFAQIGSAIHSHALSFASFAMHAGAQPDPLTQSCVSRTACVYLSRAPPSLY